MSLTTKQRRFIDEYLIDFNATQAAIRAGYSEATAHAIGWENLRKPEIADVVEKRVSAYAMDANERLVALADIARQGERDSDRIRAIELLGKLAGDYTEKVEHSGTVATKAYVGISPDDWDDDTDTDSDESG